MIDFTNRLGRHVKRRLRKEQIIWLTTVDFNDAPQPRPVWFHWDDETILIFSESGKAKLRHIERNPKVSLNFNTDERRRRRCSDRRRGKDYGRSTSEQPSESLPQKIPRRN